MSNLVIETFVSDLNDSINSKDNIYEIVVEPKLTSAKSIYLLWQNQFLVMHKAETFFLDICSFNGSFADFSLKSHILAKLCSAFLVKIFLSERSWFGSLFDPESVPLFAKHSLAAVLQDHFLTVPNLEELIRPFIQIDPNITLFGIFNLLPFSMKIYHFFHDETRNLSSIFADRQSTFPFRVIFNEPFFELFFIY